MPCPAYPSEFILIIICNKIRCLSEYCNTLKFRHLNIYERMSASETTTPSSVPFKTLLTEEVDELSHYLKHADIELIQTEKSQSPSKLTVISFDNIDLQIGEYGAACISNATTDKDRDSLIFKMNVDFPTTCNGYNLCTEVFMHYGKNSEHMAVNKGPCNWAYITFKSDYLEDAFIDCLETDSRSGKSSCFQSRKQIYLDSQYVIIKEINELTQTDPGIFKNPDILKGMELSLLNSQALLLANTSRAETALKDKTNKSHELIIKESIDFLKANSYQPIHVLDLCRALNVKLRTLYRLFQEFYGISPIKYLRLARYAKARRELIDSDPRRTSVSDIAARWHFWHFGRFSVEYKSLYGESPSETLHKHIIS